MNAALEHRFIAAIVKDASGERFDECRNLPHEAFVDDDCRRAWRALTSAASFEEGCIHANVRGYFGHSATGADYIADRDAVFIAWLQRTGLAGVEQWRAALPTVGKSQLRERLSARRFALDRPPPEPIPRFLINGKAVCTSGNLTNLIAQAKAGKSAFTGAMLAAAICAEIRQSDRDTLGVTASAPQGRHLLHVDTEQSPFDHHAHVMRALRRAGVESAPPWLSSYSLAGFSAAEARRSLNLLLAECHAAGGVFAAIIDGTADLVNDVNDPAECNPFVAELHDAAIKFDCPIINVVHENPGQDGGKMRGHLGSQLERKAESNLRLRKSEQITVLFSERMRRAPILEADGPRFVWSDVDQMHVSCAALGAVRLDQKRIELADLADEVIGPERKRYADIVRAIQSARQVAPKTAEKRFGEMSKAGVIVKDGFGFWSIAKRSEEAA